MVVSLFNLIFKGEIKNGYDLDQVKKTVAELFDLNEGMLEEFFSGHPVSIKEKMDPLTANCFKQALDSAGVLTHLEASDECLAEEDFPEKRRRQRRLKSERRRFFRASAIQPDRRTRSRREY